MNPILCIDFGSTYTKVVGIDVDEPKILGRTQSFTTVKEDINIGLEKAIEKLARITGINKWPTRLACSSAAGGLKMIAIGLVPQLTMEVAKRAALSAGAKILKTYSFELNEAELHEIAKLKPDIILFTGGIDGGNQKVVLHNAHQLARCSIRCPLVYAGNKAVADHVKAILTEASWTVHVADNVMPVLNELKIDSARALIREIFLEHIVVAKGLSQVQATTDVHSVAEGAPKQANVLVKGLSDLKIKRTVEGDLGARYSLPSLVEVVGIEGIAATIPTSVEVVHQILKDLEAHPDSFVSEPGLLKTFDDVAAEIAVRESVTRHAGTLEVHYTPFGTVYQQSGKDLSHVSHVIGTGGPLIHHHNIRSALKAAQADLNNPFSLKPLSPNYYLDKQYILAAMGLLSIKYPKQALALMKGALVEV